MRRNLVRVAFVLSTVVLLALPAAASDPGEGNVLFRITAVDTDPAGQVSRRSTEILVLSGTRGDVSAGWKVPIPTTSTAGGEADGAVTSYSYQDVGFLAWINGRIMGDGRVHAAGRIEISAVEPGDTTAPTITSFSHKFDVLLDDGAEISLARAPRPDGGAVGLRVSAEIQR